MVYMSALDIVGNGKGLYRLGFPCTTPDLIYDVPFPTFLVNGEFAEDNDISKLVRELIHVEFTADQFEELSDEINSVRKAFLEAVEKTTDKMAGNALIVYGVHENNDIPVEDVLRYMEFPAPFHPQLRSAVSRLIELDIYKKRKKE